MAINAAFRICHKKKIEEMLRHYMLCQQIDPEEKIYIVTYAVTWYTSLNQLKKTTCFGTLFQGIFGKSKLSLATYKDPKCNNFQQFVSWSQNREIGKWTYSWQQRNEIGMANHQSWNSMKIWISNLLLYISLFHLNFFFLAAECWSNSRG